MGAAHLGHPATESALRKLPGIGATDGTDPTHVVKFFTPDSSWTWLLTEYDPEDDLAFGFAGDRAAQHFAELGYVSVAELRTVRGHFNMQVERDLYFEPASLKAAIRSEFPESRMGGS